MSHEACDIIGKNIHAGILFIFKIAKAISKANAWLEIDPVKRVKKRAY